MKSFGVNEKCITFALASLKKRKRKKEFIEKIYIDRVVVQEA